MDMGGTTIAGTHYLRDTGAAQAMQIYGTCAGTMSLAEKMIDLSVDFMTVHAILGVQRLTTCIAVAVVTAAEAVAMMGGEAVFKVTATAVLTANGAPPADKGDARSGPGSTLSLSNPSSLHGLTFQRRDASNSKGIHHVRQV